MVTKLERRFILLMVRLRIWRVVIQMRLPDIQARFGTRWLLRWIKRRQVMRADGLHHAPCCPANHYHYARVVFSHCTCGANRAAPDIVDAMAYAFQGMARMTTTRSNVGSSKE